VYSSLISFIAPLPPRSTLFPYTTLFRSTYPLSETFRKPKWTFRIISECIITTYFFHILLICEIIVKINILSTIKFLLLKIYLPRSEEHTSELQSRENLVCRLLLEKKKKK